MKDKWLNDVRENHILSYREYQEVCNYDKTRKTLCKSDNIGIGTDNAWSYIGYINEW